MGTFFLERENYIHKDSIGAPETSQESNRRVGYFKITFPITILGSYWTWQHSFKEVDHVWYETLFLTLLAAKS